MKIRHVASLVTAVLIGVGICGVHPVHGFSHTPASCDCAVWVPGIGMWSDPARWQSGEVPGSGADPVDILINGLPPSPTKELKDSLPTSSQQSGNRGTSPTSEVAVDLSVDIMDLNMGLTDIVRLEDGQRMSFVSDTRRTAKDDISLFNNGQFFIDGATLPTELYISTDQSLAFRGNGRLVLIDQDFSHIVGATGNELFSIESGVVEGAGQIGLGSLGIINRATIDANVPFQRLTIHPSTFGVENTGVIRARDFGRIDLINAVVNNTGGLLEARNGSTIDLNNVIIQGGTIATDVDAVVRSTIGNATFENVQISGNVEVGLSSLSLQGTITNNGTIYTIGGQNRGDPEATMLSQVLILPALGDVTLDGSGSLVLSDATLGTGSVAIDALLINGIDHTISGGGNLGNNTLRMRNDGLIHADDSELPLLIDPSFGSMFENNGTIMVSANAKLFLIGGAFDNQGEFIIEEGGELYMLPGATLTNSLAGGLIGGTWTIRGQQTKGELVLVTVPDLDYNMASVILDGPLSTFERFDSINTNLGYICLLNGRAFISESNFTNAGVIDVGSGSTFGSNGKLTLNNASQVKLEVAMNTTTSGTLNVSGQLVLNGIFELKLAAGVAWNPGMTLNLIQANSITGAFDTVIAPGRVDVVINGGSISFTALPDCPGELSGDDQVDVTDLLIMLDQWGFCPAGGCVADIDDSGDVNIFDLLVLLDAWGSCPTN